MESTVVKSEGERRSSPIVDEAMTSIDIGMDHLQSVRNRVWNLIAHGSKRQQEAEVYITLLTLRQLIHDRNLNSSLLSVLEQSNHTSKDVQFKIGTQDESLESVTEHDLSLISSLSLVHQTESALAKTNLPGLPDEIIVKIMKRVFLSSQREDIDLGDGVHLHRPEDHAILRTCHHLKDIGMQHYHESTAVFIDHRERKSSEPINWRGRTFMIPSMIVNNVDELKGIYYVLERFPKLKFLELDRLTGVELNEQAAYHIDHPVSWKALKSKPLSLFTSYLPGICFACSNPQDMCDEFKPAFKICRRLRSKISKVDFKFQMWCSNVKCLIHPGFVHDFRADYVLTFNKSGFFSESHALYIIGNPEWDMSEKLFGRNPDEGERPDCNCEAKFQD